MFVFCKSQILDRDVDKHTDIERQQVKQSRFLIKNIWCTWKNVDRVKDRQTYRVSVRDVINLLVFLILHLTLKLMSLLHLQINVQ